MNQHIKDIINKVEENWRKPLITHTRNLFTSTFLPSHDLNHHLRTWDIAKSLLKELGTYNNQLTGEFVEGVMIAIFFHDAGMTKTRSSQHGKRSRELYEEWVAAGNHPKPVRHPDIARAIELHDRKEEDLFVEFPLHEEPDLLTLVNVADDLDALGIVGIYRYAEIYLHRHVSLPTLGIRVLENVSLRFNTFSKVTALFPAIKNAYQPGYREIITFYDRYNQQVLAETDPSDCFSGHLGVINYISQFSVKGTTRPVDFPQQLAPLQAGKFVVDYFEQLKKNLVIYEI